MEIVKFNTYYKYTELNPIINGVLNISDYTQNSLSNNLIKDYTITFFLDIFFLVAVLQTRKTL
jgi:hypothetical protein